jgi:hypothetical protein
LSEPLPQNVHQVLVADSDPGLLRRPGRKCAPVCEMPLLSGPKIIHAAFSAHARRKSSRWWNSRDRVNYAVLGGVLVDRLFVRPDVERIFAFRRKKLLGLFQPI